MKFWIGIIISFFVIACQTPGATQSVKNSRTIKKEEKADIDSLFIVYSLPIYLSHSNNFRLLDIEDSLIALLQDKKYKNLDKSAMEALFKTKLSETLLPRDVEGIKEWLAKTQSDKNYYINKAESADPYAQHIQLSFLTKDSGINYINVRRLNPPNYRKFRDWFFTYPDSETSDQFAVRILDSLINTRRIQ